MHQVDVLVRVNGDGQFLAEALNSVLGQSVFNLIKCHVSVFMPTKSCLEIIETYKNVPNFCFHWIYEPGYSLPLNQMLRCQTSELIAILDHDDVMHENRIELQLNYMNIHEEIGGIGTAINIIDSNSQIVGAKSYPLTPADIKKKIARSTPIAFPSSMIRKHLIEQVGGFRAFYDTAEDYDLWLRLVEVTQLANLSQKLTSYRIHKNQVTSKSRFLNLAASHAALKSSKLRAIGGDEIHKGWESVTDWASRPFIRFTLTYEVWFEGNVKKFLKCVNENKIFLSSLYLITAFLLNPIRVKNLFKNRIRKVSVD